MQFTQHEGEAVVKAESHIEEQEDGTFKLIWTRFASKGAKLDVVRPGRR